MRRAGLLRDSAKGGSIWTRPRGVVGVIAFVVLLMLTDSAGRWDLAGEPIWTLLALATFVLSAMVLALFVPRRRSRLRPLRPTPCGLTTLMLALGAPLAVIATAHHEGWALMALGAAGFALMRRID